MTVTSPALLKAAPDLLAICKTVLAWSEAPEIPPLAERLAWERRLRLAIAKAEGKIA